MAATTLFGPVTRDLDAVEDVIADAARVEHPFLAGLLEHILQTRGKRLRPALVLLAAGFYDYSVDRLKHVAAGIELLHTATLVHDDLVDGSSTRRGVATLHSLVDPRSTVLVGDYIFAKAASLCSLAGSVRVMGVFGETLMTICDGELRQILSSGDWRQAREEYFRKIQAKTASLFSAATQAGAILSGAPEPAIGALRDYGLRLGMAFQIVDDILDFVGDEEQLGKPVGSDLRQRIITLPALWLLENRPQDRSIRAVFESNGDSDEAVRRAVAAVINTPAIDFSVATARSLAQQARDSLRGLPDAPHRDTLNSLADYVIERTT